MRFGVHTGQQDCSYQDLRKVWRLADTSGMYWASVWDHFYETPALDGSSPSFEAVSTMAALAAETTNLRVGSLVFCAGYRSPGMLAKAAVTIDHISNGRAELGLGAGWHRMEFEEYGYQFPPPKVRLDMLEEALQIIQGMLSAQEATTFAGEHFQVTNARCNPKPLQGKLPVWVGGAGERRTLRIAARYADGWNGAYISPEAFQRKSQILDQWCEREGRDPAEIARSINVGFYMGADEKSAQRHRAEFPSAWDNDGRLPGMLFGAPREAIERVGEYAEAGANHLNIALRAPFDMEAVQAFIEEVMPAFSDGGARR